MTAAESLSSAAASGNRKALLIALQARLAAQLDLTDSARDVAALSARLVEVSAAIAALPAEKKGTALDELAARRASAGTTARQARARRG